jgi:hypothetical protein
MVGLGYGEWMDNGIEDSQTVPCGLGSVLSGAGFCYAVMFR